MDRVLICYTSVEWNQVVAILWPVYSVCQNEGVSIVSFARELCAKLLTQPQWSGIKSLRFLALTFCISGFAPWKYILSLRIPNLLPILRHRSRRFSPHVRVSRCSSEVCTTFFLPNHVYQGVFHYQIRVTTMPAPSMYSGVGTVVADSGD